MRCRPLTLIALCGALDFNAPHHLQVNKMHIVGQRYARPPTPAIAEIAPDPERGHSMVKSSVELDFKILPAHSGSIVSIMNTASITIRIKYTV